MAFSPYPAPQSACGPNVIHVDFRKSQPVVSLTDEWPSDTTTVRIVIRSEMDHRGFQSFYVLWRDTDGAKSLHACIGKSLASVQAYLRDCGRDVEVVERIGVDLQRRA